MDVHQFGQFFDVSLPTPGWQVHGLGGPESAGNYTVEGQNIVRLYNRCRHQRSTEELSVMGKLNKAFHEGRWDEARQHLATARQTFPQSAGKALEVYAGALD